MEPLLEDTGVHYQKNNTKRIRINKCMNVTVCKFKDLKDLKSKCQTLKKSCKSNQFCLKKLTETVVEKNTPKHTTDDL